MENVRRGMDMGWKYACHANGISLNFYVPGTFSTVKLCGPRLSKICPNLDRLSLFGQKYPKKRDLSILDKFLSNIGLIDTSLDRIKTES